MPKARGPLDLGGNKLTSVANGSAPGDVVPLGQADGRYGQLAVASTYAADQRFASGRPWFDVTATSLAGGADPTGGADSYPAIQAAITAAGAAGGTVFFPQGNYTCSAALVSASTKHVTLAGPGGATAGAASGAKLLFTGTGAGSFITAQSCDGFVADGLQVLYNSSGFTGYLIDLRNTSGSDSAFWKVTRCLIGGSGASSATAGIALDKANTGLIEECSFEGTAYGILGRASGSSYSNANTVRNCHFVDLTTAGIRNPGQGWAIEGNTFENLTGGGAGGITCDSGAGTYGTHISGNWFGDATTGTGTVIAVNGGGFAITGNYIGYATGMTAIAVGASSAGFRINGNRFDNSGGTGTTAISLGSGCASYDCSGNGSPAGMPSPLADTASVGALTLTTPLATTSGGSGLSVPAPSGDTSGATDTAALQAMLTALPSGAAVTLPASAQYWISAALNITKPVTISGAGTINQVTSAAAGLNITSGGVTVEGITLNGPQYATYTPGSNAIAATGPSSSSLISGVKIRQVTITNWGQYGIKNNYVRNLSVTDCDITGVHYAGTACLTVTSATIGGNRISTVPGSAASSGDAYGITLGVLVSGATADPACSAVTITGNTVRDVTWTGIDMHSGDGVTVSGNTVINCPGAGIAVVNSHQAGAGPGIRAVHGVKVTGNTVHIGAAGTGQGQYGIVVQGAVSGSSIVDYATGVSVTGNTVTGYGIPYSSPVQVGAITLAATRGASVSGNVIEQPGMAGIALYHDNPGFSLGPNTITDVWDSYSAPLAGGVWMSSANNTGTISAQTVHAPGLAQAQAPIATASAGAAVSSVTTLTFSAGYPYFWNSSPASVFAATGSVTVPTSTGTAVLAYTGVTATTLTGVTLTSGTGTVSAGFATQAPPHVSVYGLYNDASSNTVAYYRGRFEGTTEIRDTFGTVTYPAAALAGDLGNTAASPQVTSTHLTSPLPPAQGGAAAVSPMTYGAVFNGTTDDSADISTAIAAGGTIQFPPGTTVVNANQLKFASSSLHIRGAGMYDTTVKCTSGSLSSLWIYGSSFVSDVELSDMTLDGTGAGQSAIAVLGNRLDRLRVRRVRFINWPAVIIQSGYAAETIAEDCEADGAGLGLGTFFLSTNRQNESVILRRNRLRWINTGITIGSGNPAAAQYHSAYIDISDNYIDLGWYLLKAVSSNSGGTVTYGANTVTDSSAAFGTIAAGTTVRALTPLVTGTLTTIGTQLTDASANFTTSNVWRGHIVRSGSAFAVVSKVESATQLHVEEWLSQTTYQPVTPPSAVSYAIYGVTLGAVVSNTATTVTIAHGGGGNGGNWYDLHGNEITPAAGTLYEVLPAHPVYPVFCNIPTEKVKIHGNTIRRGWGDGIEFFGSRGIITGNIVEDGQDEGIVCEGYSVANPGVRNIVSGNICRHNGTSGLNLQYQADLEVGPNQLEDNCWGDPSSLNLGQLEAYNLVNSTITGGRASSGSETALNPVGMTIDGASTSGLKVIGWSGHGATVADIRVTSAVPAAACDLLDTDGVIAYQGTTNGQRLRVKGTGVPSLIASPGSQFLSASGSGAGTTLYVKESGNGSGGWDVMSAPLRVFSPMAYGAIGDGTANDTAAVQAAYTAAAGGGTVDLSGHAYLTTSAITLSSSTRTIAPPYTGTAATGAIINTSSDMFSVTGSVSGVVFDGGYYQASGGHVFNAATASCSRWVWLNVYMAQGATGSRIWHMTNGLYLDMIAGEGCYFQAAAGATAEPWYVVSALNGGNSNTWRDHRISMQSASGGTVPFYHLENTAATGYGSNNRFCGITAEQCSGGIITALSQTQLTIDNVVGYDVTTYAQNVFTVGTGSGSGLASRIVCARNSGWVGGTLAGGVYDFSAPSAAAVVLENVGPQSTGFSPVCNLASSAVVLGLGTAAFAPAGDPLRIGAAINFFPGLLAISQSVSTANNGYYARLISGGYTFSNLNIVVGASSGNISVAAYTGSGTGMSASPAGGRLATSGAIACPAIGGAAVSLGTSVTPSLSDWVALSADNTTATFQRCEVNTTAGALSLPGWNSVQASAHPLPATPSSLSAAASIGLFMMRGS